MRRTLGLLRGFYGVNMALLLLAAVAEQTFTPRAPVEASLLKLLAVGALLALLVATRTWTSEATIRFLAFSLAGVGMATGVGQDLYTHDPTSLPLVAIATALVALFLDPWRTSDQIALAGILGTSLTLHWLVLDRAFRPELVTSYLIVLATVPAARLIDRRRHLLGELRDRLAESHQRLEQILETAREVFFEVEPGSGAILSLTPGIEALLDVDAADVRSLDDLVPGSVHEDRAVLLTELHRRLEPGEKREVRYRVERASGGIQWLRIQLSTIGDTPAVAGVLEDITDDARARSQIEEQLRQAQKMEAVGRLAGGVAHDFNNLLMVVTGNAHVLALDHRDDPASLEHASAILRAADRAAGLTARLLMFARQQPGQPSRISLNDVVRAIADLTERSFAQTVEIQLHLTEDPTTVLADRAQVEQVAMNLLVNARDAMPAGGRIDVETAAVVLAAPRETGISTVPAGRWVRLAVRDAGTGIDPAILPRVLEPFFTTKSVDKGTGLGLATVHGVLEQTGGHLEIRSELGVGSEFVVYLPRWRGGPRRRDRGPRGARGSRFGGRAPGRGPGRGPRPGRGDDPGPGVPGPGSEERGPGARDRTGGPEARSRARRRRHAGQERARGRGDPPARAPRATRPLPVGVHRCGPARPDPGHSRGPAHREALSTGRPAANDSGAPPRRRRTGRPLIANRSRPRSEVERSRRHGVGGEPRLVHVEPAETVGRRVVLLEEDGRDPTVVGRLRVPRSPLPLLVGGEDPPLVRAPDLDAPDLDPEPGVAPVGTPQARPELVGQHLAPRLHEDQVVRHPIEEVRLEVGVLVRRLATEPVHEERVEPGDLGPDLRDVDRHGTPPVSGSASASPSARPIIRPTRHPRVTAVPRRVAAG